VTTNRGVLLVLAIALAIARPAVRVTEAQSPRPVKIGALTESWGPTPGIVGLRDGLQELGYRENRDFVIGVWFVQGNLAELPEAARTLARQGVDLIVTSGGDHSAKAAQQATATIPIVFLDGTDPVSLGLVRSLARPGGNITGIADLELELVPKGLEIFSELVPGLRRVLLVYDATTNVAASRLKVHRDAAQRLGLTLVERPVHTEDEARSAIMAIKKSEVDGIFSPRLLSLNIPGLILEIGPKRAIPTMFEAPFYVERERGGLASYGADKYALGRQAARLVDKILKGEKPGNIPVEQPTTFDLTINLKAAKALGIAIPPSMLLRANRLIQ
jgi:putative ABC transport system substrate-binding protein